MKWREEGDLRPRAIPTPETGGRDSWCTWWTEVAGKCARGVCLPLCISVWLGSAAQFSCSPSVSHRPSQTQRQNLHYAQNASILLE